MLSHFHLYGVQRSSGVMGRRNGPSGLRDDDDDDGVRKGSPMEGRGGVYGGKDLRKRYLLSLEWKRARVMDNDSGGNGTDELRQFG